MKRSLTLGILVAATGLGLSTAQTADATSENLGNGFRHHGVATPVSNHRGTVATVDDTGRNVVLVWLFDHRGGYALLMIDAETGKSEQFPMPFPPGGDCPYAPAIAGPTASATASGTQSPDKAIGSSLEAMDMDFCCSGIQPARGYLRRKEAKKTILAF